MDSDDPFDEFSEEVRTSSESEETNAGELEMPRREKTKRTQFDKMISFTNDHREDVYGKEKFTEMWAVLAKELNDLGPPMHTTSEWRKVWTEYKYQKNKKKRSLDTRTAERRTLSRTDHPKISKSIQPSGRITAVEDNSSGFHIYSEITKRLDVIIEKQTENKSFHSEISRKFDLLVEQQTKSNELLQAIVDQKYMRK